MTHTIHYVNNWGCTSKFSQEMKSNNLITRIGNGMKLISHKDPQKRYDIQIKYQSNYLFLIVIWDMFLIYAFGYDILGLMAIRSFKFQVSLV